MGQQMWPIVERAVSGDHWCRDELRSFFLYQPRLDEQHGRTLPIDFEQMVKELKQLVREWQSGRMDGVEFMYCIVSRWRAAYREEAEPQPIE
jgi:hypothetical protein